MKCRYGPSSRVVDRVGLAPYVGDVTLVEVDHAPRHRQERRRIGREEMIAVADADDERASLPRAHDPAGFAGGDHGDGVGTVKLGHGRLHRVQEIAATRSVPVGVHQVRDDLGVGLRAEDVPQRLQALAQRLEVLDDAVVDDGDLVGRDVRMGVGRGRRAVRRPTGVGDAGAGRQAARVSLRREVGHARGADHSLEAGRSPRVDDRQPRRVVTAVFESADAVDQDRDDVAR
jgi:hypothetical protein